MEFSTINFAILSPSIIPLHVIYILFIIMLCFQPANSLRHTGNETDRLALLQFKANIANDPYSILSSWNDSANFCRWRGITCGHKHQRVTSLDLHGLSLVGTLSPYIRNLTFLRLLNLAANKFHGEIPQEVGHLWRLRNINLTINKFEGTIPANISNCPQLRIMDLDTNNLVGKIPDEVGSLKNLVTLYLGKNNLTGEIPRSFGNLSSLQDFSVYYNHLQGNIPSELGQLTSLGFFSVGVNNLTGTVPSTLYNLSSIAYFFITLNQLTGSLPPNIGFTLPNLIDFGISTNQIHGTVPLSLTNASQLRILDISANNFEGQVPTQLGNLRGLQQLNLGFNFLGSKSSKDLSFITSLTNCSSLEVLQFNQNNFGGALPRTIGNFSIKLGFLDIDHNQISGKIPVEVGNIVNLYSLDMHNNHFSGTIPSSLGKLVKLQVLTLEANMLYGEIPISLGNITELFGLDLSDNNLEGNITTSSIWYCHNLDILDISNNHLIGSISKQIIGLSSLSIALDLSENALTGPLPTEIGNLKNVRELYALDNKLSGKIPGTIGDCLNLRILNLSKNFLEGPIPSSFVSLRGLESLDLARNNLSGKIPNELEKLLFLQYLDLSFNNLEGEVPKKGVFSNISAISLAGNKHLCGGIPELHLPACPIKQKKHRKYITAIVLAVIISPIVIFMAVISLLVFYRRKQTKHPSSSPIFVPKLPRISYKELLQATQGFSPDNLIGQGSFGSVYRGSLNLQGERLIAVKVLDLQQHGASRSFIAECRALQNIRHRNLVKILTYCSSIDFKGNDFKALVFDFMANGSLEMWLHPKGDGSSPSRKLSLLQRIHIVIDVSSALNYLHDHCQPSVIHCDLKPSNILLDSDMIAHVGDFGLARLLYKSNNSSSQGQTSSIGLKGTIGYMAPEYGVGGEATQYGDIYSFGIILLEIFTGRRPTDEMFTGDLNLRNFVRDNLPGKLMQVLDPILTRTRELEDAAIVAEVVEESEDDLIESLKADGGDIQSCVVSVLEIGLACSADLPSDRMDIKDVTRKLNVISEVLVRRRTQRDRRINVA